MTNEPKIKSENRRRIAPLKNVVNFATLVQTLQDQDKQMPPRFGVFYSYSGYGKSHAGIFAQLQLNCVKVDVSPVWHVGQLLRSILIELGRPASKNATRVEMSEAIMHRLSEPDAPTLIIDEADFLLPAKVSSGAGTRSMIEVIRALLEGSAKSIILIGEEDFPKKLMAYERCYNRVLSFVLANPCDVEDAQQILRACYPNLKLDDALLAHIVTVSRGVARRIDVNFNNINNFAQVTGQLNLTLESYTGGFNDGLPPSRKGRVA